MKMRVENSLEAAGYMRMLSNKPEFTIFFQEQNQFINVVSVLDLTDATDVLPETFSNMNEKVRWKFMDRGFEDIHVLSLVIAEDLNHAKWLIQDEDFAWIIDAASGELLIPEGKVEDFYGMKHLLVNGPAEEMVAPFRERPFVNKSILALNILVFVLCTLGVEVLYNVGVMRPKDIVENGQWYRMITSIFLHADMDHIMGNMLILFCLGNIVERSLGHMKYFILYMAAGLAGNVLSLAYSYWQMDFVGSLGASGAVYGMIGALLWILMCNRGHVEDVTLPRVVFLVSYSLYFGFTSTNVDNSAHIGGLIAGFILGVLLYRKKRGME